jgi:hypothetical protein
MKKLIFLFSFLVQLAACQKASDKDQNSQRVYFEHYAINYAWGLSYVHWIIDNEGNVLTNRKKEVVIWINKKEMNEGIIKFDSVIYKIDKTELQQYVSMIEAASKGQIDSSEQHRADFGKTVFNCYYYDKQGSGYRTIILSEMSDNMDKSNLNNSAVKIDNWLKSIHAKIYSKI